MKKIIAMMLALGACATLGVSLQGIVGPMNYVPKRPPMPKEAPKEGYRWVYGPRPGDTLIDGMGYQYWQQVPIDSHSKTGVLGSLFK